MVMIFLKFESACIVLHWFCMKMHTKNNKSLKWQILAKNLFLSHWFKLVLNRDPFGLKFRPPLADTSQPWCEVGHKTTHRVTDWFSRCVLDSGAWEICIGWSRCWCAGLRCITRRLTRVNVPSPWSLHRHQTCRASRTRMLPSVLSTCEYAHLPRAVNQVIEKKHQSSIKS